MVPCMVSVRQPRARDAQDAINDLIHEIGCEGVTFFVAYNVEEIIVEVVAHFVLDVFALRPVHDPVARNNIQHRLGSLGGIPAHVAPLCLATAVAFYHAIEKQFASAIFTRQYGANSYNLDVPERTAAIDALYRQELFNRDGAPESVRNILDRYDDIDELMPDEIKGPARAMFADWLIEQVYLVEIKSPSDDDGYGDLPNPEKREHYLQQNTLAQTFHEKAYERNPGLRRLIEERAISFKPYADLRTIDLEERQTVVTRLAEEIWNVSRLSEKGLSTLEMDERETA